MKKVYIAAITIVTLVGVTLGCLYCYDMVPFWSNIGSTPKQTQQRFQQHRQDIGAILEPYNISVDEFWEIDNDFISYSATIPLQNDDVLSVQAFQRGSDPLVYCTVGIYSPFCEEWQDCMISIDQYPFVFEIMAYYSNGRLNANELLQTATDLQACVQEDIQSRGADDVYYHNKDLRGMLKNIAEVGYGYTSNLDEMGMYQSDIEYRCYAYC